MNLPLRIARAISAFAITKYAGKATEEKFQILTAAKLVREVKMPTAYGFKVC